MYKERTQMGLCSSCCYDDVVTKRTRVINRPGGETEKIHEIITAKKKVNDLRAELDSSVVEALASDFKP